MSTMGRLAAVIGVMVMTVLTGLSGAACATHGRPARPEPFPRPGATESARTPECQPPEAGCDAGAPPLVGGSALVAAALDLRGRPYAAGGSGPEAFDCSGFVQYVFSGAGIALPRTVTSQFEATAEIPFEQLAPGDLLFFRTSGDEPTHVAIAIGDGTFVHAPSSRGVVRVESLASSYWRERFDSVRRLR